MYSKSLIALAAGAALVAAKTPSGFTPASTTDLIVTFGKTEAMNGVVVDKATTQTAPTIATSSKLTGSSYAIIMLDLDIPSNTNPHVLLHWMQTDLTPATTTTSLATANGTSQAFVLQNAKNTTALAAYIGPGPPAKTPLSHRYTQILVDTSSIKANGTAALKAAAATRNGFDITTVLKNAGLSNNVVAGNSFNVTNPGPADDSGTGTGTGTNSTSGSGSTKGGTNSTKGTASGTGSTTKPTSTTGTVTTNSAYGLAPSSAFVVFSLVMSWVCL
ncbi:PEBP-like protein [Thozetella sp. PMI_491]|nr:PEBP-like protein [Thozetella sp. PMI_491]